MRATRRLDELRREQTRTVGLNQGAIPGKTGSKGSPVLNLPPTLAEAGIGKHLAHQARTLGALSVVVNAPARRFGRSRHKRAGVSDLYVGGRPEHARCIAPPRGWRTA